MSFVASRTSKANWSAKSSSKSCRPSSHSGKSPTVIASQRSRRWKSGSAPLIFTASFHTTDCMPELRLPVELHERRPARGVDEPERVDAEALHEPERARDGPVRHRPHQHVRRLRHRATTKSQKLSCAVCGLREAAVGLLLGRVDQVGELDRVLDEEHRDVVADDVPVALAGCRASPRSRARRGRGRASPCCRRRSRSARTRVSARPRRWKRSARVRSASDS